MDVALCLPQLSAFTLRVFNFLLQLRRLKLYKMRCQLMCYCFNNTLTRQDGNQFKILPQIILLLWLYLESKNGAKQMWNEGTSALCKKREGVTEQSVWMMVKNVGQTFNSQILYGLKPHLYFLVTSKQKAEFEMHNVSFYQCSLYLPLPQHLNNP